MDVLILTVFISLMLVAGGLSLFVGRLKDGDFEHGDRLSLMPLADDTEVEAAPDGAARTIEPRNSDSAGSGDSHGSQ
jgi:hypothetical protein